MKQIFKNIIFTIVCLTTATLLAFLFFHFGQKNSVNTAVIYTLSLILIAQNTSGYWYGIAASLFCVIAANYFFTLPYFALNFTLAGYPITFIGMLTISLITSAATTTLKQQKALAAEQQRQLVEREKEQLHANLLRAVSHDLRTPLTSMIGLSSTFMEEYSELSDSERLELVNNINEDSQWLLNMVENLLSVTRIRGDSMEVKKSLEIVEEVVSESIIRLQKRHENVQIHVTMPTDFLMVPMDPTLIEQVLINLLENAYIHSSSQKPIELVITDAPDELVFSVIDYGIGLAPEKLPYIFDGQTSSDSSDSHKGLGIGLSICRTIIHAHKGWITAENHSEGAKFSFSLPKEKE